MEMTREMIRKRNEEFKKTEYWKEYIIPLMKSLEKK